MAVAFLQATGGFSNSAGTTIAATYGNPVAAGNLLVCSVTCDVNAALSVSDTVNSAWVAIGSLQVGLGVSQMFYKANSAAGTPTVTATSAGGAGSYRNIRIGEWSGVATSSPLNANNSTTGTSTTPAVNVTTIADHDLAVGGADVASVGSAGGSFNSRAVIDGNVLEDKLDQTPAGILSVAFSQTISSQWNAMGAAFLLAAAASVMRTFNAIPFIVGGGL